jgi:hypothetical protein
MHAFPTEFARHYRWQMDGHWNSSPLYAMRCNRESLRQTGGRE